MDENQILLEAQITERIKSIGDNVTDIACLNTFGPSTILFCQHVFNRVGLLDENIKSLGARTSTLVEVVQSQQQSIYNCAAILKECQKQISTVINGTIERHALNPAVEAVVALADELFHLNDTVQQLQKGAESNPQLQILKDQLQISASIARDKLVYLDIERITPEAGETIDPYKHTVLGCTDIQDSSLHGKVSKFLTAGIIHRSKVLQQARVLVFRHKGNDCKENNK